MYSSVWNRVALLITGLAFGWTLVKYQVVASPLKTSRLIRLLLALVGGVVAIGVLALARPAVGLGALLVFLSSALVGYAGNAKQTAPPTQVKIPKLERSEATDDRVAVLLVHDGEPVTYDGPADWGDCVTEWQRTASESRHWLARPRVYARLRAAYDRVGGRCGYNESLAQLGHAVVPVLGAQRVVETAFLRGDPRPVEILARWAEMGISSILIVPIGLDAVQEDELRTLVTRSRAREMGLWVRVAPWSGHADWQPHPRSARFEALLQGIPVSAPPVPPAAVADLAAHVSAHLPESA